jgi:acyl-CoA synthetase (AMP-forming)/AMP-acid ligase II
MTSNPLPKHGARKPGSVGRAQGGVQVAILDAEGAAVPQGEVGEVCIKGDNVTAGYLNNPKANAEAFTADGWFRTGDQGRLDERGYLFLTGRIKELINRGGEKISPLEVDGALLGHPAVAEAISFGAPDPKYGEIVAAAVVLKDGALAEAGGDAAALLESIRAHCAKQLSAFKVPAAGLLFIADALPKGATGKVQRRHMPAAFLPANGAA